MNIVIKHSMFIVDKKFMAEMFVISDFSGGIEMVYLDHKNSKW